MNTRSHGTTMRKVALCAALLVAAAALPARVIDSRRDAAGFPLVVPKPRRIEATDGMAALPAKEFTVSLPESESAVAEILAAALRDSRRPQQVKAVPPSAKPFCRFELVADGVPASPEGYTLEISGNGITARSRDGRGLYYAGRTLEQIIRNSAGGTLPGCRITDFPDLATRGVFFNAWRLANRNVPAFCDYLEAMAALKLNMALIEFDENLPIPNSPFTKRSEALTPESLAKILETAKRHHLEIVPQIQTISHTMWMNSHPDYLTKIISHPTEKDVSPNAWAVCICPRKPLGRELTDLVIRETVRLLKPKSLMVTMDEFEFCRWRECRDCPGGHTPQELEAEVLHNFELVRSLGVRPWFAHDSFLPDPKHPGESAALLSKLPKDSTVVIWLYSSLVGPRVFDFYRKNGFTDQLGMSFCQFVANTRTIPIASRRFGARGAVLTYWGYLDKFHLMEQREVVPRVAASTTIHAEYCWNAAQPDHPMLGCDPAFEFRRRIAGDPSVSDGGAKRSEIALDRVFNTALGANPDFPQWDPEQAKRLQIEAGASPERFRVALTPENRVAAVVLSGGEGDRYPADAVTIPVRRAMAGFGVLGFTRIPNASASRFDNRWAAERKMPEIASFTVRYRGGKTEKIPLRYLCDINHWNSECSGWNCRFIVRGNDAKGAMYGLFAANFALRDPRTPVESIVFASEKKFGAAPALLALSAWGGRGAEVPPAPERCVTVLPDRAPPEPSIRYDRLTDFAKGMKALAGGEVRVGTSFKFSGEVTHAIVDDPSVPEGKVLRIVVPPPDPAADQPWVRVYVDVPLLPGKKVGSLCWKYRISCPEAVMHSGAYLMDGRRERYYANYTIVPRGGVGWILYRGIAGRDIVAWGEKSRLKSLEEARWTRLSFWMDCYEKPIEIRIAGAATAPEELPPVPALDCRRAE